MVFILVVSELYNRVSRNLPDLHIRRAGSLPVIWLAVTSVLQESFGIHNLEKKEHIIERSRWYNYAR